MTCDSSDPFLRVKLRPEEPGDEEFLFTIYASTREQELDATGWPADMRQSFLKMQFTAMRSGYKSMYPQGQFSIILLNNNPVGRMVINRGEQELRLVDIALLSNCRSHGIGTFLLQQLLDEAKQTRRPIVLNVLVNNPARHFYQRLGFQIVGQSELHLSMRWLPAT